jgi:hypothetical protein
VTERVSCAPRRLDVVLDVVDNGDHYRVWMVGVFEPGASPPMAPGTTYRNVIRTWEGYEHRLPAFSLPAPAPEEVP